MLANEQITNVANWKHRLLYGNYKQSRDAMKNIHGYCCLGVAAETIGREFERESADQTTYRYKVPGIDRVFGGRLAEEDVYKFGFYRKLTGADIEFIERFYLAAGSLMMLESREDVLIQLNDSGYSFAEIVEFVERIGWDK